MPELRVARRVVVRGRVQGVFFRASAAERAAELGISGWIRNRPDRTVEAHIEGAETAVGLMLDWLRTGPELAVVSGLDVTDVRPTASSGFDVR